MASNDEILRDIERWLEQGESSIHSLTAFAREEVEPRRWKGTDLQRLLRLSAIQRVYDAESDGRLPEPDRGERSQRLGYTLDQALKAMDVFGTCPSRKGDGDDPVILAFTNFKGGCWKTTTAWYFASWAATQGYRVLAVDLDPQASLTRNLGMMPDLETDYDSTLAPFIMRERPIDRESVRKIVRPTHLPTLHLIPGALDLQAVEWQLSREVLDAGLRGEPHEQAMCFLRVGEAIQEVMDDYDLVVIDGTPTLGLIPLNIIFASDGVVVPVPTEVGDFCSTVSFLRLLHSQFRQLSERFGDTINLPQIQFLPTRFAPGGKNTMGSEYVLDQMIRKSFGADALEEVIRKHDSVISNLGLLSRTAFEVNAGEGDVNRESRQRAMANFGRAFDEIMRKMVLPHWPSKQRELEMREVIYG